MAHTVSLASLVHTLSTVLVAEGDIPVRLAMGNLVLPCEGHVITEDGTARELVLLDSLACSLIESKLEEAATAKTQEVIQKAKA